MIVDFSSEQLLAYITSYSCAMRTHFFHDCKTEKSIQESLKQAAEFTKLEWVRNGDAENHPLKKVTVSIQKSPSALFLQIETEAKKLLKQVALYSLICSEDEQKELTKLLKAEEKVTETSEPVKKTRTRAKAAAPETAKPEAKNGRKARSKK